MDGRGRVAAGCGRIAATLMLLGASVTARAECLSLVSGPIVLDVQGCKAMEPETFFDPAKSKYKWITDLDAAGKKQFYATYRGLYIRGKVVKSSAIKKGLSNDPGALNGETIGAYIPPGGGACTAYNGKRLSAEVKEICCDGSGDAPCLLATGFILGGIQVAGTAGTSAGDADRQKAKSSKDYQEAQKQFDAGNMKKAVAAYERARNSGDIDVLGLYNMGSAYRKLDQCGDAIKPLKMIYDKEIKKQIWADEEPIARKAIFLLAKCYAKMNEPSLSTLILQGYLVEPDKYRSEIKESLNHKDFGWIHTAKEYREYKKAAQKKLK